MALSDELAWTSASEIARRIRARELSPVEVVDAFLARIAARNPSLTAFVHLDPEGARAAARKAETAVMRGDALGPLHGVPTAIKDLFDFKPGWPATLGGVRALKDFRPDWWCVFAERIERAGAIILGKTNSPTMGFRGVCDNYLFGPSRNPFDMARNTGGSSGGSAAAVADGLVPFAEGTDGGGSIRIPSSWCGVYGFKASAGRVPVVARPNGFVAACPFIHEGPIARTVEDAALVLGAIAGYDARDPLALDETVDFRAATQRPIKGMRIAWSPDLGLFPVEPAVAEVVAEAVKAFADAGAIVEEVPVALPRTQRELSDLWCRLIMPLSLTAFAAFARNGLDLMRDHADDFPPELHHWRGIAERQSAVELFQDLELRTEVYDAIQAIFAEHDLLVTPTLACLPVENATDGNTLGPAEVAGEPVDRLIGWCLTYPFNFTGHPAASIPAGLAAGSLPVGLQIVGRRYADADVLAASAAFEKARPWAESYRLCEARPL
jgi:amidase/aspartyl-tRNA(Asn)/glutamyl-tRNA(Gln) amidotransferase subunit A